MKWFLSTRGQNIDFKTDSKASNSDCTNLSESFHSDFASCCASGKCLNSFEPGAGEFKRFDGSCWTLTWWINTLMKLVESSEKLTYTFFSYKSNLCQLWVEGRVMLPLPSCCSRHQCVELIRQHCAGKSVETSKWGILGVLDGVSLNMATLGSSQQHRQIPDAQFDRRWCSTHGIKAPSVTELPCCHVGIVCVCVCSHEHMMISAAALCFVNNVVLLWLPEGT